MYRVEIAHWDAGKAAVFTFTTEEALNCFLAAMHEAIERDASVTICYPDGRVVGD